MTTATLATRNAASPRQHLDTDPTVVPWSTVLPLAIPLGLSAGFWTIALRTSLGSIERATPPFTSWARESALLLPFFVLAVLAALTTAQRRYGRDVSSFTQVGLISLLVAGSATLAGAAELALSSAYDYHLQVSQVVMMTSMRDDCPAACRNAIEGATLGLQERSVLIGTLLMLLTNVLLVAWVLALRGGRLRLTSAHTGHRRVAGVLDRLGLGRTLLISGLVGSAAIHAAVVPEHLAEWTAAGAFFVLLTAVELGLAAAVATMRRSPLLYWGCAAASVGPLLLWLGSRTAGLPFGPEPGAPEPVGLSDVSACALELVTAVAAIALARRFLNEASGARVGVHGVRLALVLVLAISGLGLGGTGLRGVGFGVEGMASTMQTPSPASTRPTPADSLNQHPRITVGP